MILQTESTRLAYTYFPPPLTHCSFSHKQNIESWKAKIRAPLVEALATPLIMVVDEIEIVSLKAIVECSGYATQKNGKPYNNKWVYHLVACERES